MSHARTHARTLARTHAQKREIHEARRADPSSSFSVLFPRRAATVRSLIPECVSIFLVAESERALAKRLIARKTEPLDKALVRVETAQQETGRIKEFDYVVENQSGQLDATVAKICAIIDAEKMKVKKRKAYVA